MLTRRQVLQAAGIGSLAWIGVGQAQEGLTVAPSDHWLNSPKWCLAWWLMRPGKYTSAVWRDMLRNQVGFFGNMGVPPSATSGPRLLTQRPGGRGEVQLDGTNDEVFISGLFGSPAIISLAMWVRLTAYDGGATGSAELFTVGSDVILRALPTQIELYYRYATNWRSIVFATNLRNTGWRHLVGVIDPARGRQELYLDGRSVVVGSFTDALDYDQGPDSYLGRHSNDTGAMGGALDDVRVFAKALSPLEVRVLYRDPFEEYATLLLPHSPSLAAQGTVTKKKVIVW